MKKTFVCIAAGASLIGNVGTSFGITFSDNFDDKTYTLSNWYSPIGNQTTDWTFSPSANDENNLRYYGHKGWGEIAVALNNQFNTENLNIMSRFGYFPWTGDTNTNNHHSVDFFFGANNLGSSDSNGYFVSIYFDSQNTEKTIRYYTLTAGSFGENRNSMNTQFQLPSTDSAFQWMQLEITADSNVFDVNLYSFDVYNMQRSNNLASLDNVILNLGNVDGTLGVHTKYGDTVILGRYNVDGNLSNTAPVPEPTTMLLFGTGLAGLAAVGRRRR